MTVDSDHNERSQNVNTKKFINTNKKINYQP